MIMSELENKKLMERLRKCVKPGCFIVISTKTLGELSGYLDELDEAWLSLDCESGTEFVNMEEIIRFSVKKDVVKKNIEQRFIEDIGEKHPEQFETSIPLDSVAKEITTLTPSSEEPVVAPKQTPSFPEESPKESTEERSKDEHVLRMLFCGTPAFTVPQPIFDDRLKDNKDFWILLSPWRSKYEYACKVKEYNRLSPLVSEIKTTAEKYCECKNSVLGGYLFYLAGLFLYHSGHTGAEALQSLKKAIDYNYVDASLAYASILIENKDYAQAAIFLAKGIKLRDGTNCEEAIRALGQCIMQLPERKIIPIGEILEAKQIPHDYAETIKKLLVYMVGDNKDVVAAILNGSVDDIRMTKVGNDLFPWGLKIQDNIDLTDIAGVSLAEVNDKEARRGRISAFYVDKNMGFLIETPTGQTWYFNSFSIIDTILTKELYAGKIRQEVYFHGDLNSGTGKYPAALKIEGLNASGDYSMADTRAPLHLR